MAKCSFCGNQIEAGTGKMFIFNTGKINYFCSRKCETNLLSLKRKPLETAWTQEYRREHKKGVKKETKP
ncbi:ribosomal protein L24e family protein [Candidatus Woesearchaeota archaeon]|nr:ribosomal protein L24e family protein [Candidatus Woesearchaeota archaeon]